MESTDFLVIGSGIAGLVYALDVASHGSVTVICKSDPNEGNTHYAQGGIASVISPLDSFEAHSQDTLIAGAGLCHQNVVNMVVSEGPARIKQLIEFGTHFDRGEASNSYDLVQEGGHSARRVLHTADRTGAEIQRAIYERVHAHSKIRIFPHHIAIDLITRSTGDNTKEVVGAYSLDKSTGKVLSFGARATLLASGGLGKVYLYTSNPDVATGDGIGMAFRAGARIANMEFIQFHPTCLYHPRAKSFLISEAVRGEGAKLLNYRGQPFMHLYHEKSELAPRDIVARAIDDQMKKTGADHVLLDISFRGEEFISSHFPGICARVKEFGFDMAKGPIPVVPAAHYACGGVVSDMVGKTDLKRLYVAGEVACTGLHGANRLASNSLLEAIVFAHRAALDTIQSLPGLSQPSNVPQWDYLNTVKSSEEVLVSYLWDEVRALMWNLVGIVRSDKRLLLARRRLEHIKEDAREYYWKYLVTSDLIELRNIIQVAELIVSSAIARRESRGLHFNVDCPEQDDVNWRCDTIATAMLPNRTIDIRCVGV